MISLLIIVLIVSSIILIAQKDKRLKIAGKILLIITLIPFIGIILLFGTCLVILGIGSFHL